MTRQVGRDQLGRRGQMRPELGEIGALAGEAMQGYGSHRKGGASRGAVGMGIFKADFAPLDSANGKAGTVCPAGG